MADPGRGARTNGTSNPWGSPATGDELELALRAAEQMLVAADERHRHAQNRAAAAISILISMALVTAGTAYSIGFTGGYIGAILTLVVSALVSFVTLGALVRDRQRHLADNTLRLATEIATLVGDVMAEIARREGWSYLRRESTMLRLSAFPLLTDLEATRNQSHFRVVNGNNE